MYLYLIFSFSETMLQAANTDPSVPKAHNDERQNLPFPLQLSQLSLQKSQLKLSLRIFIFCPLLGTNGLVFRINWLIVYRVHQQIPDVI